MHPAVLGVVELPQEGREHGQGLGRDRGTTAEAPPEHAADPVELASDLSFPASDPPAWIFSGR